MNPNDSTHPDNSLLELLRLRVRGLDQQAGKTWDDASERMSAAALVMAKENGFTAKDNLQLAFNELTERRAPGEILHLSRSGLSMSSDPAANRAHMTTAEALSQPAQERYQQVDAISQTQSQALLAAQQQTLVPDDPSRTGPTLRV